ARGHVAQHLIHTVLFHGRAHLGALALDEKPGGLLSLLGSGETRREDDDVYADAPAPELDRELDTDVALGVAVLTYERLQDLLTDVFLGGVLPKGLAIDEVEHLARWHDRKASMGGILLNRQV